MKILYFGVIAELKGTSSETLDCLAECPDIETLKAKLFTDSPAAIPHIFRVAVNQQFVENNVLLEENDEVAFMPPFSGG